jgi:nucleosome assembly protein 1-like 1
VDPFPDQPLPESFFDFFNPPQLPPPGSPDENIAQMKVAMDYGYGEVFKEAIVPDAVDWFTGEAKMEDGDGMGGPDQSEGEGVGG